MLLGHRYYDASVGRFISSDPAKAGNNWYAYCDNNALKKTDNAGLDADTARIVLGAAATFDPEPITKTILVGIVVVGALWLTWNAYQDSRVRQHHDEAKDGGGEDGGGGGKGNTRGGKTGQSERMGRADGNDGARIRQAAGRKLTKIEEDFVTKAIHAAKKGMPGNKDLTGEALKEAVQEGIENAIGKRR